MKKTVVILLLAALLLAGCGKIEDPHPEWDKLARADNLLAIETPDGFTLNESKGALSLQDVYYFSWSKGDGSTITNAEGSEAVVYDCQIYLLAAKYADKAEAEVNVAKWMALEEENYDAEEADSIATDCGSFRVLTLYPQKDDSPFTAGAAAFMAGDTAAISVEVFCANGFDGDLIEILRAFLSGIRMD